MCYFPNIQYVNNYEPLHMNQLELPRSPKGMYTILIRRNIVNEHFLDGIKNMNELEEAIFNLIDYFLKSCLLWVKLKNGVKIDDGVIIAFWLHPIPFRTRT